MTAAPALPAAPLAAAVPATVLRSGPTYWLASLRAMLRFEYGKMRQWALMLVLIETTMGAGMALLYGFFYPHVTAVRAIYITTGAPTLALIPVGFVMVPGSIGLDKLAGTFDYMWSLPAPRSAQVTATFLLYSVLALPGTALALLVATWRYGVNLSPSPLLLPAVVLCSLMAVSVGYGMALAIANAMVANLISNALDIHRAAVLADRVPRVAATRLALRIAQGAALLQHGHGHKGWAHRRGREQPGHVVRRPGAVDRDGLRSYRVGGGAPALSVSQLRPTRASSGRAATAA